MTRQYWLAPIPPLHVADGSANATAVLTDISPAPPIIIAANQLERGSRLKFYAAGRFTSTATPGTVSLGLYIGAVSAGAIASGQAAILSGTLTVPASKTNQTFRIRGEASIRTDGAGTAATLIGTAEIQNVSAALLDMAPATAPTAFAFDSTVANIARIGMTASVATGSWTLHYFGVEFV